MRACVCCVCVCACPAVCTESAPLVDGEWKAARGSKWQYTDQEHYETMKS